MGSGEQSPDRTPDPLETLALDALRRAAEHPRAPTPAEQYDTAHLRALTPAERIDPLIDILRRAECVGRPDADRRLHRHRTLLL